MHLFPRSARYGSVKVKPISYATNETKKTLFSESQHSYIPLSHPPNRKALVQQDISRYNWLVKCLSQQKTKLVPCQNYATFTCRYVEAIFQSQLGFKIKAGSVLIMFCHLLHLAAPYSSLVRPLISCTQQPAPGSSTSDVPGLG